MAKQTAKDGSKTRRTPTNTEETGRLQPQERNFERAIIGALMIEKDAYSIINETLKPESFYEKSHELIFRAIQNLAMQQNPIDILTVVEELRKEGTLEEAGGAPYIAELSQKVVSSAHLDYHARIIAQKYIARELISFSSDIANQAFDETTDVEDLVQEAEGQLYEISKRNVKKDVTHIKPIINEAFRLIHEASNRPDGMSGVQSGFKDLDKITLGWQNSDLIIIAARPSMGKTAFVLSMAKNMAVNFNAPVGIFSLEMSNVQLVNRLIVNVTELTSEKIKSGKLAPYEWQQLDSKVNVLYDAPIYVDDTPSLSVFELRTKSRRLVKDHKVSCIIIDYLQLMNAIGMHFGNRQEEVALISKSLKSLAKELNIPVIALSQLNRSVETRTATQRPGHEGGFDAKRPQLSDLRESGSIEQDADIVCFIHRPEYYKIFEDDQNRNLRGKAEIIIAKHRNGKIGDVLLEFKHEYARFQNLDENQIIEEHRSRVNSLESLAPVERGGAKKLEAQNDYSEVPF
jgi:replicative DNA helicase